MILEVKNLDFSYGSSQILFNVSVKAKKGSITCLMGSNGVGKTSLLKQAEELGIPAVNGIGMLLYQGCEAFTFWTGKQAPEKVMRNQLISLID